MPSTNNTEDKYAATTWGAPVEFDFKTPSGQLVLMKKLQIEDLMQHSGLLTKSDLLTGIVNSEVVPANREAKRVAARKGQPTNSADADVAMMKRLQEDPQASKDFLELANSIVISAVIKPELHPVPAEGMARTVGLVYVDSVGFNDKMAIFNKAMEDVGSASTFREGSENAVGAVEDGKSV